MIGLRRRHPYIRFDKEISTKAKNDIFVLSHLARSGGAVHPKELSEEFMISTAQMELILVVALGVGVFLTMAILRILKHFSLSRLLMILYLALIALSFFIPDNFVAVAFDARTEASPSPCPFPAEPSRCFASSTISCPKKPTSPARRIIQI